MNSSEYRYGGECRCDEPGFYAGFKFADFGAELSLGCKNILKTIAGHLKAIDSRLKLDVGRLKTIDGQLKAIDSRLKAIDGRLKAIDGRFKAIKVRLKAIKVRLKAVKVRLKLVHGNFKVINADLQSSQFFALRHDNYAQTLHIRAQLSNVQLDAFNPYFERIQARIVASNHSELSFDLANVPLKYVDALFHASSFLLRAHGVKRRTKRALDHDQITKSAMKTPHYLALSLTVTLLSACIRAPEPAPAPAQSAFKLAASIQDLMASIVDPSADALWESVSSETTAKGIEEHQPHTDAEWQSVRNDAVTLQEAGDLLTIPGRAVTHAGKKTEDHHVAGVSNPDQVKAAIDASRPGFNAAARALQDAAAEAIVAVDAKDPVRLLAAGGKIDQACERCHSVYWYPNAREPSTKFPAPLATTATASTPAATPAAVK